MSRLQVGGLALVVGYESCARNLGKVVVCEKYIGDVLFDDGSSWNDCWIISGDNLLDANMNIRRNLYTRSKFLMPLGDKQTQDELAKEIEYELN